MDEEDKGTPTQPPQCAEITSTSATVACLPSLDESIFVCQYWHTDFTVSETFSSSSQRTLWCCILHVPQIWFGVELKCLRYSCDTVIIPHSRIHWGDHSETAVHQAIRTVFWPRWNSCCCVIWTTESFVPQSTLLGLRIFLRDLFLILKLEGNRYVKKHWVGWVYYFVFWHFTCYPSFLATAPYCIFLMALKLYTLKYTLRTFSVALEV